MDVGPREGEGGMSKDYRLRITPACPKLRQTEGPEPLLGRDVQNIKTGRSFSRKCQWVEGTC